MPPEMQRSDRVEVVWHPGEADVWYRGTPLDDGRVHLDDYIPFAPEERLVLEPEEIAGLRPASQCSV